MKNQCLFYHKVVLDKYNALQNKSKEKRKEEAEARKAKKKGKKQ
jgi:hypothetical protein